MTLLEGHWSLEQEINQLSNGNNPGATDSEKDRLINIAINDFVNLFFYGKNPKQLEVDGFEENQRRLDMFENLIFGYPEEPKITTFTTLADNMYSFNLSNTKQTYREYITANLETNCGDFSVSIAQHNDGVEKDYHRMSSKRCKIANALLRNGKLYIKAEEFTPIALKLTYLKKPNEVSLGTYPELDLIDTQNNPSNKPKVEWDINPDYHHILVTIAAQNYMRIYEKQVGFALSEQKINKQ